MTWHILAVVTLQEECFDCRRVLGLSLWLKGSGKQCHVTPCCPDTNGGMAPCHAACKQQGGKGALAALQQGFIPK